VLKYPQAQNGLLRTLTKYRSGWLWQRIPLPRKTDRVMAKTKPNYGLAHLTSLIMVWLTLRALPGVPREVTPVEIPLAAEQFPSRGEVGLRVMGR